MPSFGEKLKLEREKRAITLEQISLSTKIGTRMLQALEEEKFSQLPGGIFNKGFVRAYARHIGLDEDQAVADYLEASGEAPPPKPVAVIEAESSPPEPREPSRPRQLPWGMFAALLLLLALALSLWSRRQHVPQPLPSRPPVAATQKPDQAPASPASPVTTAVDSPAKPVATFKTDSNPAPPATVPVAVRNDSVIVAPPPAADEFVVVILAREDSWLSVTADGKDVMAETLAEGNQRAVRARKEVVVKAGNTGALDFVFNGRKLASQGSYGEVKTLTFGSGGLQANAPPPPAVQ